MPTLAESLLLGIRRFLLPLQEPCDDAQLLLRFSLGEESAFSPLMSRYAPLVWGVCRRLLIREQDAEDAFQATFLVLLQKARSLRGGPLGPWLYGVAYRVALKARERESRRVARERRVAELAKKNSTTANDLVVPTTELARQELQQVLDEEVMRLPEHYRSAFLLCEVEGQTVEEASQLLGCARGTVLSRLARARERLRQHLTRRGIEGSTSPLMLVPSTSLMEATARMFPPTALTIPASVVALVPGAFSMTLSKMAVTACLLLVTVPLVGLIASLTQSGGPGVQVVQADDASKATEQTTKNVSKDKDLQAKTEGKTSGKTTVLTALSIRQTLEKRIQLDKVPQDTLLKDILEVISARVDIPIYDSPQEVVTDRPIRQALPEQKNVPLKTLLRRLLASENLLFLIRNEGIEIVRQDQLQNLILDPFRQNDAENQIPLVWENFVGESLGTILERLAEDTIFSLIVDERVRDKVSRAKVTARFANVPLDTTVKLLVDMQGLAVVRVDNVLYITDSANANRWDPQFESPIGGPYQGPRPLHSPPKLGKTMKLNPEDNHKN